MRLIDSSDPTAVPRAEAIRMVHERLVLANAVCAQLDASDGQYAEDLSSTALRILLRWVGERYPRPNAETHASDGLGEMAIPPGIEAQVDQLRAATRVCSDLAFLWTADTQSDFHSDSERLSESLEGWRRTVRRSAVWPMRGGQPAHGGPEISIPQDGLPLSPLVKAGDRPGAERLAADWNEVLIGDPVFGQASGFDVSVGAGAFNGDWPLVWRACLAANSTT